MSSKSILLRSVDQYRLGQELFYGFVDGESIIKIITKIELENKGCGLSGFYDLIFFYLDDECEPDFVKPAHKCDIWHLLKS